MNVFHFVQVVVAQLWPVGCVTKFKSLLMLLGNLLCL